MNTPKQIAERIYPALNARDYDAFISHFDANVDYRDPDAAATDATALLGIVQWQMNMSPDGHFDTNRITATDCLAVIELNYTGTFVNDVTMPDGTVFTANGKRFDLPIVEIIEVENGKVCRHRCYWDNLDVYTQLGLIPGATSA